jgi:hypothetical protein
MAFAFSNKQFAEAMTKVGVSSADELLSIPAGGMIRKTDKALYSQLRLTLAIEDTEAEKDDEYMYQGFLYELGNHEFCITYDPDDTLACFGLTYEKVEADKRLLRLFVKARKDYLKYANR